MEDILVKIRVYPTHGWSSYVISIWIPGIRYNSGFKEIDYIDDWVHDNLNMSNMDKWERI